MRRYRHDLTADQCSNARTNTSDLVNSSYLSHLGTEGQVSSGSNQGHQRLGRMIRVIFDGDHSKKREAVTCNNSVTGAGELRPRRRQQTTENYILFSVELVTLLFVGTRVV